MEFERYNCISIKAESTQQVVGMLLITTILFNAILMMFINLILHMKRQRLTSGVRMRAACRKSLLRYQYGHPVAKIIVKQDTSFTIMSKVTVVAERRCNLELSVCYFNFEQIKFRYYPSLILVFNKLFY
ncbi:unnamed protein product [Chrysodeixis includens]|uniref:Uncharacterized protein n=1 Tax=Chrysodeixis includens TaxID=689277 RepID=A0A9P0C6N2_CHRIL|nr:unnamed protein product [Chrysodeixis includens]